MPLDRHEILAVLRQVSELKDLQTTVIESVKGAGTVGICALGGGLLGGPVGLGIGGIIGSVFTMISSRGKYKSAVEVILSMTTQQQIMLAKSVEKIILGIDAQDVMSVVGIIMASNSLQAVVVAEMAKCLRQEMGLCLR